MSSPNATGPQRDDLKGSLQGDILMFRLLAAGSANAQAVSCLRVCIPSDQLARSQATVLVQYLVSLERLRVGL